MEPIQNLESFLIKKQTNNKINKYVHMAAVELKALPWQHIDPSSIILGPEMKLENRSVKKKNKKNKTHLFLSRTVKHLSVIKLCC